MKQWKKIMSIAWLKRKAFFARLLGKSGEALACLEKVAQRGEAGEKEWWAMGTVYAGRGEWDKACHYWFKAHTANPQNPRYLFWLGKAKAELGEVTAAEFLYDEALKKDDKNWEAVFAKGQVRLHRGDYYGAFHIFKKCLQQRPNDVDTLNALGVCCLENNDCDTAVEFLQKALLLRPSDTVILNNYATASIRRGEYRKAVELLELDKEDGNKVWRLNCLGYCYSMLGEYEKSMACYKEALELNPKNSETMLNLAAVYAKMGKSEWALEISKKLVVKNPLDAELLNNLAWVYETLENHKAAEGFYFRSLAVSKGDPQIAYNLACCLQKQSGNLEALDILSRLKNKQGWRRKVWSLTAQIYEGLGEDKLAVDCYNKAFGLE